MSSPETPSAQTEQSGEQLLSDALAGLDVRKREFLLEQLVQHLDPKMSVELKEKLEEGKESLENVISEAIIGRLDLVRAILQNEHFANDPEVANLNQAIFQLIQQRVRQDVMEGKDVESGRSIKELFKEYGKGALDFLFLGDAGKDSAVTMGVLAALPVVTQMGLSAFAGPAGWVSILGQAKGLAIFSGIFTGITRLINDSRGATFSDRVKNFFASNQALLAEKRQQFQKKVVRELEAKFKEDPKAFDAVAARAPKNQEDATATPEKQESIRRAVMESKDPATGETMKNLFQKYGKPLADFLFFGDANKQTVLTSGAFVGLGALGLFGGPAGVMGAVGVAKSMALMSAALTGVRRMMSTVRGGNFSERVKNFFRTNESVIKERQQQLISVLREKMNEHSAALAEQESAEQDEQPDTVPFVRPARDNDDSEADAPAETRIAA